MSTFCIKRLIFSLYALSYLAVNFTAYLTDKYYHEHVADIFNRLEYGVTLIGKTLSVAEASHYSSVFLVLTLISLDYIAGLTLKLKNPF